MKILAFGKVCTGRPFFFFVFLKSAKFISLDGEIFLKIPFSFLDEIFSVSSLNEGDKILFNAFYTILENKSGYREHFAALFDKDSEKTPLKKLKNVENLGVLTAVEFY